MALLFLGNLTGLEISIILFLTLGFLVLPIVIIIQIATSTLSKNEKTVWILLAFFIPVFGSIAYFLFGKKTRRKR